MLHSMCSMFIKNLTVDYKEIKNTKIFDLSAVLLSQYCNSVTTTTNNIQSRSEISYSLSFANILIIVASTYSL